MDYDSYDLANDDDVVVCENCGEEHLKIYKCDCSKGGKNEPSSEQKRQKSD